MENVIPFKLGSFNKRLSCTICHYFSLSTSPSLKLLSHPPPLSLSLLPFLPIIVTFLSPSPALKPIPTLLVASQHGLSSLKLLTTINSSSLLGNVKPESVAFLAQESDRLFWLDFANKLCENSESPYEEVGTSSHTQPNLN